MVTVVGGAGARVGEGDADADGVGVGTSPPVVDGSADGDSEPEAGGADGEDEPMATLELPGLAVAAGEPPPMRLPTAAAGRTTHTTARTSAMFRQDRSLM